MPSETGGTGPVELPSKRAAMRRKRVTRRGELALRGDVVPYTLHRVVGRRHVHLVLGDEGELQVRAPWCYTRTEAEAAIREHADWVVKHLQAARELCVRRPPLRTGTTLPLLDARLRLDVRPARERSRVRRRGNRLHIDVTASDRHGIRNLLEEWYREEARRFLPARVDPFADALRVSPTRITVRGQRTRWGSCSARGAISLNWRLMLLPIDLVDYVIVHELCHLRYMDHSHRFWALVARVTPNVEDCRRRLREVPSTMAL